MRASLKGRISPDSQNIPGHRDLLIDKEKFL